MSSASAPKPRPISGDPVRTAEPASPPLRQVGARPTKGEETRAAILDAALKHASTHGYEALTIGVLAEKLGMSKSGLFAHFGSKEDLQIATLDEAARRYTAVGFIPALAAPRGLKRVRALFTLWLEWTERSELAACPIMAASAEYSHRPGPMRDAVEEHVRRLHLEIMKAVEMAVATGELAPDTEPDQVAFEAFGIIASCYQARYLFHDPRANARALNAFERLVASHQVPPTR
ncbi:MAG: TetR/AcrR family transcriptional regulator [Burkholderiales bacterium]